MLAGKVFDTDPESLIMRFSKPVGGEGDRVVMAVHRLADDTLQLLYNAVQLRPPILNDMGLIPGSEEFSSSAE